MRRVESLKLAGEVIGNHTRIKVVKGDVLDLAVNLNIIVKAGAWFSYNDAKIGQGRENAKIYLSQHPDIMAEVENKVRAHYNLPLKDAEPTALAESGDDAE